MPTDANDGPARLADRATERPWLTLGVVVLAALVLAYSTLIQQELLLAVWLLATGVLVYLVWRFVRAHERLAGAAERLADGGEP